MSGTSQESPQHGAPVEDDVFGPRGLDRRSLIKKAGIVGAAAWVAPMVIDSMISPASAASIPPGLYKLRLSSQRCLPTPVLDPNVPQACLPPSWGSATLQISDSAQLADFGITVGNCTARYALQVISNNANVTFLGGNSCKPANKGGGPNPADQPDPSHVEWPGNKASDRNGYFITVQVV
jgi:hypothetical protein